MVKTVGVIDWVPQPGYPELSGKPGGEVLTCKYIVSADRMDGLPEYNTPYKNELYRFFNGFDYLLLKQRNVKTLPGGGHYEVTLIYEQSDAQLLDVSASAVEIECEQDTREETYPLEYRPNYRCRWNRRLLARRDTASTVPGWWSTAATTVIPAADQDDYRWISPGDQVPDGWYELCSETKPGVDGFLGGGRYRDQTFGPQKQVDQRCQVGLHDLRAAGNFRRRRRVAARRQLDAQGGSLLGADGAVYQHHIHRP